MNEPTENLVLELLRCLRNEMQGLRQQMQADFGDVKERLATVERLLVHGQREDTEVLAS